MHFLKEKKNVLKVFPQREISILQQNATHFILYGSTSKILKYFFISQFYSTIPLLLEQLHRPYR